MAQAVEAEADKQQHEQVNTAGVGGGGGRGGLYLTQHLTVGMCKEGEDEGGWGAGWGGWGGGSSHLQLWRIAGFRRGSGGTTRSSLNPYKKIVKKKLPAIP